MRCYCKTRLVASIVFALWAIAVAGKLTLFIGGALRPATVEAAFHPPGAEESRSGKWPKVRADHLAKHPRCAACGCDEELQVHHVMPFHLDQKLELDPDNLITLCAKHHCHFWFGHLLDYQRGYNPHVRQDAARMLDRIKESKARIAKEKG